MALATAEMRASSSRRRTRDLDVRPQGTRKTFVRTNGVVRIKRRTAATTEVGLLHAGADQGDFFTFCRDNGSTDRSFFAQNNRASSQLAVESTIFLEIPLTRHVSHLGLAGSPDEFEHGSGPFVDDFGRHFP